MFKIDKEIVNILSSRKSNLLTAYTESKEEKDILSQQDIETSEAVNSGNKNLEDAFVEGLHLSAEPGEINNAVQVVVDEMRNCIESYLEAVDENGADSESAADEVGNFLVALVKKMQDMKYYK